MFVVTDILSYVVFVGFEFAAVCAMTRVGRGWPLQLLGLLVFAGVDFLMDRLWRCGRLPLDAWLAVCFICNWVAIAALTVWLSRESIVRRVFLALAYGAYCVCFAVAFHLIAYRNIFGLTWVWAGVAGFAAVVAMNLAFLCWILPWMPQDGKVGKNGKGGWSWRAPCIVAGTVSANMFACGLWPISVVTAPGVSCLSFLFAFVVTWVAFPMLCRAMRERLHNADVERRLEQMMAEMKARRAAIDETRRLRHDMRFHRVQMGEYLLNGQYDKALAYFREMDAEAEKTPTDKLVWCENETVNAILSGCSRKAAAKGVELSAEANVEKLVALPDMDLVAVFANLIDNAIEAAGKKVKVKGEAKGIGERATDDGNNSFVSPLPSNLDLQPPTSSPRVTVTIRQRDNGIGIAVANPVPEGFALSAKGLPCETPGIGLESVRQAVARHRGEWLYTLDDGVLKCRLMLKFGV